MLDAALETVWTDGLAVTIDQLSLEDIIARAGVSRSTVYRKWPRREDFFAQVLTELAESGRATVHVVSADLVQELVELLSAHLEEVPDATARRNLLVEVCRIGANTTYRALWSAPASKTHLSLAAMIRSHTGALAGTAVAALRQSEGRFQRGMAVVHSHLLEMFGRRLRPHVSMLQFTAATAGALEGTFLEYAGYPTDLADRSTGDPFGTGVEQEWTTGALAFTGMVLALTEETPGFTTSPDAFRERMLDAAAAAQAFAAP